MRILRGIIAGVAAAFAISGVVAAQERGTVTGTVVDQATQQPLLGAQVTVAGTQIGTLTNQQGRFLLVNVPAGDREIRVTLLGYSRGAQTVAVLPGETVTADFALAQTAVAIEGVVVTATGEMQRRREVGSAVGTISADALELAAVTNFSDMLMARTPGVTVQQSGGSTGTGARVRVRGSASVSLSNEPLVIIDGVRLDNTAEGAFAHSIPVGGQTISRLNDINPDDIESIEILKGPAAAAMYGTAAANGVIQITTRRGRAGEPLWNAYVEGGTLSDPQTYPANFGRRGMIDGAERIQCTHFRIATGACVDPQPEMLVHSPMEAVNPFRGDGRGDRQKYGLNVSGGGDIATYYLSGDHEREFGIYPNNALRRTNLRGNVRSQIRQDLDVTVTTGWMTSQIGLPQNDNNLLGQLGGALLGLPVDTNLDAGGNQLFGYAAATPRQMEHNTVDQEIRRFTSGVTANYLPLEWLSFTAQAGVDNLNRHDNELIPPGVIWFGTLPDGQRTSNRFEITNLNTSLGGTASYMFTPAISGQSSAGFQYQREVRESTEAFGAQLLPGTERLPGTSARFAVNERFEDNRTVGVYLQQQVGFNDRLFFTGALRGDDNSAFGADFGLVIYPSLMASWMIHEEPWFPQIPEVSSLRLRSAFGSSGLRPRFRDAITFFTPISATVEGQDVPAFTIGGVGDPDLKPEFSTEFEAGIDAGLFNERVGVELTYYDKRSEDALVFRRLAPSLGVGRWTTEDLVPGRFENIGRVSNRGIEALLRLQVLNLPEADWEVTGTFSSNRNRLVELGEGIEPIIFGLGGASQRHQEGFPLGGYWGRRLISFEDTNGDGIIQPDEVVLSDEEEFLGSPIPTREFSVWSTATLFNRVRISALLDGKGGYMLNNGTRYFRCASAFVNCQEAFDPDAPLFDQARAIAASAGPGLDARSVYFEDGSFVKLREVAVTFLAPPAWYQPLGFRGLSLTLSGRNLHTWTDYTGFDPEVNFAAAQNFSTADFLSQPPLRYFTARVNVNF